MNDAPVNERHRVALFRYGLISELLPLAAGNQVLSKTIDEICWRTHSIPLSERTRIAPGTLRDWLRRYRSGGFDALMPRERTDRGESRRIDAAVAERLVALKEQHPNLSVRLIIEALRASEPALASLALPVSTVHRLFSRQGLMRREPGQPSANDRRRFAFTAAGELWTSDVMHGPAIGIDDTRQKRKTYLIAFLDDATRVVPYASFAFSENTRAFLPQLHQAILRRGLPRRLYTDNGANYRSHHLALVCARLGIALIHSRPHQPQGRGKIERFFRTVRAQFIASLIEADTASLQAINRRLHAWIEGEYHRTPHRGLDGETPLDRWARQADEVRYPEPGLDLPDLFLFEATRKVQSDRTVSLNGVILEVDALLVGERITLRFDPAQPDAAVQVHHNGKFVENARRVDLYANCFVKRNRPSSNLEPDRLPVPPPAQLPMRKLKP